MLACGAGALPRTAAPAPQPVVAPLAPIAIDAPRVVGSGVPSGTPGDVAWSPDGRWIAILDRDGALAIVDAASGALVLAQRAARGAAVDRALAWDDRGETLAWIARGPDTPRLAVAVLDVATGTVRGLESAGDAGPIATPVISGHAIGWIELVHGTPALVVHDGRATRALAALEPPASCGVELTSTGDVVVCEGSRVVVRARADGTMRGAAPLPQPASRIVVAGGTIAALDRAGAVHLVAARDGRVGATIAPRDRRVDLGGVSRDGRRLALASRVDPSGMVSIHDVETGSELAIVAIEGGPIAQAIPTSDGAHVVAASTRGALVVRALRADAATYELPIAPSARIAISPDERTIAIAEPGSLRLVDRATGDPRLALAAEAGEPQPEQTWTIEDGAGLSIVVAERMQMLAWAPGRALVTASCRARPEGVVGGEGDALRWIGPDEICDLRSGARIAPPASLRPSPDAGAAVDVLRGLRVRDGGTGEVRTTLAGDDGESAGCASAHCPLVIAASDDAERVAVFREGTLRVWDGASGAVLARTTTSTPRALAMSPTGAAVFALDDQGRARVLDGMLRELASSAIGRAEGVIQAVDPEGRFWALADDRALVVLRADARARPVRAPVPEPARSLEAVRGQRLLWHADGMVELRSALDGSRLAQLRVPGAATIDATGARGAHCEGGALHVTALAGELESASHTTSVLPRAVPCQAPRALRFVLGDRAVVIDDLDAVRVVRLRDGAWVELRLARSAAPGLRARIASWDGRVEGMDGAVRVRVGGLGGELRDARRGDDLLGELLREL